MHVQRDGKNSFHLFNILQQLTIYLIFKIQQYNFHFQEEFAHQYDALEWYMKLKLKKMNEKWHHVDERYIPKPWLMALARSEHPGIDSPDWAAKTTHICCWETPTV